MKKSSLLVLSPIVLSILSASGLSVFALSASAAEQCEAEKSYINEVLNYQIKEENMEVKTEQLKVFAERAKNEKHDLTGVIATYSCNLKANPFLIPVEPFDVYVTQDREPVVREIYLIQKDNQLKHRGNFYVELSGEFDGKKTRWFTKLQFIQQDYFYATGDSNRSAYNEDLLTNQSIAYSGAPHEEIDFMMQADYRNMRMHEPKLTDKKLITQVGIQSRLELSFSCKKK